MLEDLYDIPFREMDRKERQKAIAWARQHDWGPKAEIVDGAMVGLAGEMVHLETGAITIERPAFETLGDVRAWAGY